LKDKKELIHTIKTILQVFPEGVLIRSLDEVTKRVLLEFANDEIKKFTSFGEEQEKEVRINVCDPAHSFRSEDDSSFLSLEQFLGAQEDAVKVSKLGGVNMQEQMIKLRHRVRKFEEEKAQFARSPQPEMAEELFTVKTSKVNWENNKHSYLHVFVNTTQIKKLEEAKASNK
jgi:hypothetical protein